MRGSEVLTSVVKWNTG